MDKCTENALALLHDNSNSTPGSRSYLIPDVMERVLQDIAVKGHSEM